jgi:hypothetical protein
MIIMEYVHYGDNVIQTFAYQNYVDKFEWSFNDEQLHCGDEKTLNLIIETIRSNGSIVNIHSKEF